MPRSRLLWATVKQEAEFTAGMRVLHVQCCTVAHVVQRSSSTGTGESHYCTCSNSQKWHFMCGGVWPTSGGICMRRRIRGRHARFQRGRSDAVTMVIVTEQPLTRIIIIEAQSETPEWSFASGSRSMATAVANKTQEKKLLQQVWRFVSHGLHEVPSSPDFNCARPPKQVILRL